MIRLTTFQIRWVYIAVMATLVVVYYALPESRVAAMAAAGLLGAGCILAATAVYRPPRTAAWRCLSAGVLVVAAGEVGFNVFATNADADVFPFLPDLLYLAAYPPLAVGLLWLGLTRNPSRDLTGWIETAALTLAGTLVMWTTLITPAVTNPHLSGFGKSVMVAGWVGDVAVLAAAVRVLIVWLRCLAAALLASAIGSLLIGDVLHGRELIAGQLRSGSLADLGFLVFFALAGAAAMSRSMAGIGSASETWRRARPTGLVVLAVALLVAPSVLVIESINGAVRTPLAVAVVSAAVGGLVWWRMVLAVRDHKRGKAREAEIRRVSHDLGLALDIDTVTSVLASALSAMATKSPTSVVIDTDAAAPVAADAEHLPIEVGRGRVIFAAPEPDLTELEDTLVGLSSQAEIALERIDLLSKIHESNRKQAILAHRATHDSLTGLANGQKLREELREAGDAAPGTGITALLFIDLDDFKTINDTLGHEAGDAVLSAIADTIRGCLRSHDIGARLGGDEFAVLLRGLASAGAAETVAQRIIDALGSPTLVSGLPVACRASIGLATAGLGEDYGRLLRHADTALYAAKAAGKGRWRTYQPSMPSPIHRDDIVQADLQRLVRPADHGDSAVKGFSLRYQPIVHLATGRVWGYRALIRWDPPRGAAAAPTHLIDTAWRAGLLPQASSWVLRRALTDLSRMPDGGDRAPCATVNLSVSQLHDEGFPDQVRDQLTASGMPGSRLVIDLTASQLPTDDDVIWDILAQLRHLGVRIAIADTGTGHAWLTHLRHPVIDVVTIDPDLPHTIAEHRSRILLDAIIDLANELGIDLIAAGIDDHTTRTELLRLGCHLGQGQLIAPAMPVTGIQSWTPPTYRSDPQQQAWRPHR